MELHILPGTVLHPGQLQNSTAASLLGEPVGIAVARGLRSEAAPDACEEAVSFYSPSHPSHLVEAAHCGLAACQVGALPRRDSAQDSCKFMWQALLSVGAPADPAGAALHFGGSAGS